MAYRQSYRSSLSQFVMSKKSKNLELLLSELTQERAELDGAIEELIAAMADAPPEARKSGDWAADGALTKRYLDLTNRQAEIERDIIDVSRELTAGVKPTLPN
jgi:hypothetical protein